MLRKKSKVKFFLSKASLKIFQIMMNLLSSLYIGCLVNDDSMLRKKSKVIFFLSEFQNFSNHDNSNLLSLYIGYLISYGDDSMLRKKLKLKFFTNKVSLKIFQIIRIPYHRFI